MPQLDPYDQQLSAPNRRTRQQHSAQDLQQNKREIFPLSGKNQTHSKLNNQKNGLVPLARLELALR